MASNGSTMYMPLILKSTDGTRFRLMDTNQDLDVGIPATLLKDNYISLEVMIVN